MPKRIQAFETPWMKRRREWREKNRPSAHQRGYCSTEWRKLRTQVLRRDKWTCCDCKRVIQDGIEAHVDHILAKVHGGTDDLANLQTLCRQCHGRKTAAEVAARLRAPAPD
jgi:5-methylcytosine-specific restriction enzyme A